VARLGVIFTVLSLITVAITALIALALDPGGSLSEATRVSMGNIIGSVGDERELRMRLFTPEVAAAAPTFGAYISKLVPNNVFADLAAGDSIKVLVFALLFGMAAANTPAQVSQPLSNTLDTVFQACQTLTRWINYPLPFVLFIISGNAVARNGLEPFRAMASFVAAMAAVALVLIVIAFLIIRWRSGSSFPRVVASQREALAIAVATNNTASCMPAISEALTTRLGFDRNRVDLLVPLSSSLLRVGVMGYLVCATVFVAGLYEVSLSSANMLLLMLVSVLGGLASFGMSGIATIQLLGTTAGLLGLPAEAAFVLFAAVDPLCAMLRTSLTVAVSTAAVTLIADVPAAVNVADAADGALPIKPTT
jgi:Na+/H+-dicarboxylate symporter